MKEEWLVVHQVEVEVPITFACPILQHFWHTQEEARLGEPHCMELNMKLTMEYQAHLSHYMTTMSLVLYAM